MMDDDDGVLQGCLTCSQILIVSGSMPSTRSIPAIKFAKSGWVGGFSSADLF
jgi:hypothetical protein